MLYFSASAMLSPAIATWVCSLLASYSPAVPPCLMLWRLLWMWRLRRCLQLCGARLYRSPAHRSTGSLSPLPLDAVAHPTSGPADLSPSPPVTPVPYPEIRAFPVEVVFFVAVGTLPRLDLLRRVEEELLRGDLLCGGPRFGWSGHRLPGHGFDLELPKLLLSPSIAPTPPDLLVHLLKFSAQLVWQLRSVPELGNSWPAVWWGIRGDQVLLALPDLVSKLLQSSLGLPPAVPPHRRQRLVRQLCKLRVHFKLLLQRLTCKSSLLSP